MKLPYKDKERHGMDPREHFPIGGPMSKPSSDPHNKVGND